MVSRLRFGKSDGAAIVDEVLMLGEMGENGTLLAIVREAVAGVQEKKPRIKHGKLQSAVAEGAAELAKRLLLQHRRLT
jgi:hypothetical protein